MRPLRFVLFGCFCLSACGGESEPPLSDQTFLSCPTPGALPFRLSSKAFQNEDARLLAQNATRNKDEASDTLGLPDDLAVTTYTAGGATPVPGATPYFGKKARTVLGEGLQATPLAGEFVSLWFHDGAAWQSAGRVATDANGRYELPEPSLPAVDTPAYAVLEGDGSCAEHYSYRLAPGTKVIVTDIDGTLTQSDAELLVQVGDPSYTPAMKKAAPELLQAWADKGYRIIYLTARPHILRVETRVWLREQGFPPGPVITSDDTDNDPHLYKEAWIARLKLTFDWNVVAAYGNADTDIFAYEGSGIAKDRTFIIGPLAGTSGTVAIADDDYTQHIANFVKSQPNAN